MYEDLGYAGGFRALYGKIADAQKINLDM